MMDNSIHDGGAVVTSPVGKRVFSQTELGMMIIKGGKGRH